MLYLVHFYFNDVHVDTSTNPRAIFLGHAYRCNFCGLVYDHVLAVGDTDSRLFVFLKINNMNKYYK